MDEERKLQRFQKVRKCNKLRWYLKLHSSRCHQGGTAPALCTQWCEGNRLMLAKKSKTQHVVTTQIRRTTHRKAGGRGRRRALQTRRGRGDVPVGNSTARQLVKEGGGSERFSEGKTRPAAAITVPASIPGSEFVNQHHCTGNKAFESPFGGSRKRVCVWAWRCLAMKRWSQQ